MDDLGTGILAQFGTLIDAGTGIATRSDRIDYLKGRREVPPQRVRSHEWVTGEMSDRPVGADAASTRRITGIDLWVSRWRSPETYMNERVAGRWYAASGQGPSA